MDSRITCAAPFPFFQSDHETKISAMIKSTDRTGQKNLFRRELSAEEAIAVSLLFITGRAAVTWLILWRLDSRLYRFKSTAICLIDCVRSLTSFSKHSSTIASRFGSISGFTDDIGAASTFTIS